ncbi:hypothetical protein Cgig2_015643 [Carnegiea gigantea]|uniref:Uncharacterized protein n=1 Tax=Carnegiea gigantea TaxID=171969 RepID=A0A9Q1QBX1_9CARY|nr:hypothetical protein Cgig2_015643 [Carnegiea gigantea]
MVDAAGDIGHAVDGRVVMEQVVRDAVQGNTGQGEEVDEAAVVEEREQSEYDIHEQHTSNGSTTVDNATGVVVSGEALDEGYHRRIILLLNPRSQVLTDTCVGSRNARSLPDEAHHLKYYYREPLDFVGGVAIHGDSSKVEVCGFTGHDTGMSYIVKDEVACDYFHLIDPDFPERAKEVTDDLVPEHALERDWVLDDHNA